MKTALNPKVTLNSIAFIRVVPSFAMATLPVFVKAT
jgi:hypothetical protein